MWRCTFLMGTLISNAFFETFRLMCCQHLGRAYMYQLLILKKEITFLLAEYQVAIRKSIDLHLLLETCHFTFELRLRRQTVHLLYTYSTTSIWISWCNEINHTHSVRSQYLFVVVVIGVTVPNWSTELEKHMAQTLVNYRWSVIMFSPYHRLDLQIRNRF